MEHFESFSAINASFCSKGSIVVKVKLLEFVVKIGLTNLISLLKRKCLKANFMSPRKLFDETHDTNQPY